jgi:hypothetical protein
MSPRAISVLPISIVLAVLLAGGGQVAAQQRVRTETITPAPAAPAPAPPVPEARPAAPAPAAALARAAAHAVRPDAAAAAPEVIVDVAKLPLPVARMRTRILEAARTGDLDRVLTVMQSNETMPVFSLGNDRNPITYWKMSYPDSEGVEALAILTEILEAGFVHVDLGTPQEMYVWPYFARLPLATLAPAQKVELFKIVTGSDFKEMQEFGAYTFYRVGIAPDGTWHFFVAGN